MKSNVSSYLTSFIVGAAAGTAFALLNAPQSGKKTRAQIRKEVSDVRSRTKKAIAKAQERTMDKVDDIQNLVKEISNDVSQQAKKLKKASQRITANPRAILGKAK